MLKIEKKIMTKNHLQQHDEFFYFLFFPSYDQFIIECPFLILNEWQGHYV
jgi:hypothetical protein